MVSFTPNIPEAQTPSYIGMSQPISPFAIHADRSGGELASGIGSVLKDAFTGADNTIKSVIDNALNQGVDRQREGFTGALEQIAGVPEANRVADYQPTVGSTSIVGSSNPSAPNGVDAGLNSASNVISASATGKFTPTYYTGRLDMLAKDLRSQFVGYRDYIDQRLAQETGGNPANEYIKQMLTQINQGQQNLLSEKESLLKVTTENAGIPGAALMAQRIQDGTAKRPDVNNWLYGYKGIEVEAAKMKNEFEVNKYDYDRGNLVAQKNMNILGDDLLQHSFITLSSSIGGKSGGLTFGQLGQTLNDMAAGKVALPNEAESRNLAAALSIFKINYENDLYQKGVAAGNDGFMKPEEFNAAIAAKSQRIQKVIDHIINHEYGPAFQDANFITSVNNETAKGFMTSKDEIINRWARNTGGIAKIGGPTAGVKLVQDAVADGLPQHLKAGIDAAKLDIAAQNDPNGPVLLNDYIDRMQRGKIGVDDDPSKPNPAKKSERAAYDSITNIVNKATDPDLSAEIRANIYKGVYGKGNETLIDKFADDSFDKNGNFIPGKNAMFRKLTSDKTADEAYNMRNQGHPEAWDNYKNTAENWFGKIFGSNIRSLNNQETVLGGVLARPDKNIHYTFNTDTHHIGVNYNPAFAEADFSGNGDTRGAMRDLVIRQTNAKLAEINAGIDSMAKIASKEGTDVNAYILNNLRSQNLDPASIGFKIQKAVETAGNGPQENSFRPDRLLAKAIPQAAKDYIQTKMNEPFQFPTLQDFTGGEPKPANVDENGIKGSANAAHVSPQWGNPFSPSFKDEHLTTINTPGGQSVQVNKYASEAFDGFLKDLAAAGYPIKNVEGYNLREKRGVGGISQHAFGNAIDINPDENPRLAEGNLPKNVSDIAAKWGLTWGGDWSKKYKDPMHFEFTGKNPNVKEPGFKAASK